MTTWKADQSQGGKFTKGDWQYHVFEHEGVEKAANDNRYKWELQDDGQARNSAKHQISRGKKLAERGAHELAIEKIQAETKEIKRVTQASIPWGSNRTASVVQQARMQAMRRRGGGMTGFRRSRGKSQGATLG